MLTPTHALELLPNCFTNARLVATDMDGTLTRKGKFSADMIDALEALAAADWPVIIVTGRSAGWVNGIASYLPVVGAIAENGGVFYAPDSSVHILSDIADIPTHRQQLAATFQELQTRYPQLQESVDNQFRLTDWTFDVQGLSAEDLNVMAQVCEQHGWSFTYSTVQCHIKPVHQDKAIAVVSVIENHFPQYNPTQVVTVGDSPNDVSLFNSILFPCSVGVANIRHYRDRLKYFPRHVTAADEADGFCELAYSLLNQLVAGID